MVALNKAFPVVVEMKLFSKYKINIIYGYQQYVYLVVRVEIEDDYSAL